MAQVVFQNRTIVIGYKGNVHSKWNNKRKRPATYNIGDFHYFVVAEMRPVYPQEGKIWHPCMPDPDGTITLVFNYGRKISSLNKVVQPRWFYCPDQWMIVQDKEHPVPDELWQEAVDIAKELLLSFLVSLIAHQIYWREQEVVEPRERKRLTVGEVLDEYGERAQAQLARDRAAGIPGWSKQDGYDEFFAKYAELPEHSSGEC